MAAIEICLASDTQAVLAQQVESICHAGAARIELCAQMDKAGLTPSRHAIATARAASKNSVELLVMARPRGGDFHYDGTEINLLREHIKSAADNGANGVVLGATNSVGSDFDYTVMEELIMLAHQLELSVSVHRAFDVIADRKSALNQLNEWKVKRVLTSGGKWGSHSQATDNQQFLCELIALAGDSLEIVVAGGVNVNQIQQLNTAFVQANGRFSYHAYSSVLSHSSEVNDVIDPQKVRELVEAAT
ncbi:copper homeostasis protein CutC [Thalassotalea fusca]